MNGISNTESDFQIRHELWKKCLLGDDRNSIHQQIHRMLFETGSWLVLNESRKYAPPVKEGGVQLNGMVHNLIDICFAESQFSTIRRLVDTYPIDGHPNNRDVYSLVSLLEDLKKHVYLLTRKNIFPPQIEYDEEKSREKLNEIMNSGFKGGALSLKASPEFTQRNQERIDKLTGTNPRQRNPQNTVLPVLFDNLIKRVKEASQKIETYCNKFISHAATQQSRGTFSLENLTFQDLLNAQKIICQAAAFLDHFLLSGSFSLGTPQYDLFKYFSPQFARVEDIPKFIETWKDFKKETEGWKTFKIEELVK